VAAETLSSQKFSFPFFKSHALSRTNPASARAHASGCVQVGIVSEGLEVVQRMSHLALDEDQVRVQLRCQFHKCVWMCGCVCLRVRHMR